MRALGTVRGIGLCALFAMLTACSEGVQLSDGSGPGEPQSPQSPELPTAGVTAPEDDASQPPGAPTTAGSLPDLAPHSSGFKGSYYSGSGQCSACHDGLVDERGTDVSIVQDWSSSMMANAARDPYWIAKMAAEIHRNPSLQDTLNDTCTRCHTPMANDAARKDRVALQVFDEGGLFDPVNPLFDHAMDGVSCTLCHQMEDDGLLGTVEGVSGNFNVRAVDVAAERPAYGSYSDPVGALMQAQAQFNPVYGQHLSTSESCAACHDLRTPELPTTDNASIDSAASFFPEQMVYSEWKNSDYAIPGDTQQTCQSCHMPEVDGAVMLATRGGGFAREGFSRHSFLGANTVMQSLLQQFSSELGVDTDTAQFDQAIQRNRAFLKTAASVQIIASERQNGQLVTRVRIDNQAGHKLPSGFVSRRVHVHFKVTDASGDVVFESGRVNADGSIAGVATDADSTRFEPHYESIDSPDQVQVYEAIMGDAGGSVTHTLMNATQYRKDNRLLPAGFDKVSAPDDIRTAGAAADDDDFGAGGDDIEYLVEVSDDAAYTVSVALVYQPLAYGHLQDLFDSEQVPEVNQFKTLFEATPLKAETLAADILIVGR